MLQLYNVTMRFGQTVAVDSVNLEIPKGQMVGVIGRSGAGKSTLLRMINRLIDPADGAASGKIDSDGLQVHGLKGPALRRWRASCAMIFQQFNLVGRLEVVTNVLVGRLAHRGLLPSLFKCFTVEDRAAAVRALDRLDMADFALRRAESLSGGQQQRVAIARAMVQQPRLLLADEPVASLDPRSAAQVMDALRRVCDEDRVTVICNLHHLDYARRYCDRVVGMAAGKVVFDGRPEALDALAVRHVYGDGIEEAESVTGAGGQPEKTRRKTTLSGAPLDAPALVC